MNGVMKSNNRGKTSGMRTEDTSLRCCCGNLLARLVAEGVELKCRRCKRQVILPISTKASTSMTI